MTRDCGLTPSLLLGCPLRDIISHTELPRGEGHRWALSSASKVMVNDHRCPLAKECRSRKRNMQCCFQVQQSFSGSYSHNVRHAYSHSHSVSLSLSHSHTHTHTQIFSLLHFPKLPKLAKASCLGGTMAGLMECVRPIPTPGTPMPAMPPIITGVAMPIFMLMFIPIMPWFAGIPPIPMVPVVIEGGIFAAREAGMPIVMALPAIMGLAGGLMGVTWGGELRFSPPKFWASRLTGGTPENNNTCEQRQLIHLGCKAL